MPQEQPHNPEGRWRPFAAADRPLPAKLKSSAAKQAVKLYEEWERAARYVQTLAAEYERLNNERAQARQRVEIAQAHVVDECGSAEAVAAAREAVRALRDAEDQLTARAAGDMGQKARQRADDALVIYGLYLDDHREELLAEIKPLADSVHGEYAAALERFMKAAGPLMDTHDELSEAVRLIVGRTEPFRSEDTPRGDRSPNGYEGTPFPSAEALERRQKFEVAAAAADEERLRRQNGSDGPQRYRSLTAQAENLRERERAAA